MYFMYFTHHFLYWCFSILDPFPPYRRIICRTQLFVCLILPFLFDHGTLSTQVRERNFLTAGPTFNLTSSVSCVVVAVNGRRRRVLLISGLLMSSKVARALAYRDFLAATS